MSKSESSSTSGGSGGIMNSMKAAMQQTGLIGHRHHQHHTSNTTTNGTTTKVKDGSAHPHGGSDAQVNILNINMQYHSVFIYIFILSFSVLSYGDCSTSRRCFEISND